MPDKKRPKMDDSLSEISLEEVVNLSKQLLKRLIAEEATHFNTRATWKCYLSILNHNFRTKSVIDFWNEVLTRMYKFLSMSITAQTLFLRLFTWQQKWFKQNALR
jgi:hypothetical protein